MLILVSAMLLAGGPVPPTIGEIFYGHAMGHSDPIPQMETMVPNFPRCRTDEEIQKALTEKKQRQPQSCLIPLGPYPAKTDGDPPSG